MKQLSALKAVTIAAALSALLAGCANSPAPEPATVSRAQAVLDAQYAAKAKSPPMQAAEADRIYQNYIESIGQKNDSKDEADE